MPLFSAFTPFGMLEFSAAPSSAEVAYLGLVKSLGGGVAMDFSEGSHNRASAYAKAMAVGAAECAIRRAGNELHPETSYEMLPIHEKNLGIVANYNDSTPTRRAVAGAKNKARRGSRPESLYSALTTLLGTDFVDVYSVPRTSATKWPSTVGAAPALYARTDIAAKTLKITDPIAPDFATSGVVTVPYTNWDTTRPDELAVVGDRLVIECEIPGGAEIVSVSAVAGTGTSRTFTATFTKAHAKDCSATNRSTPMQLSTKRHLMVVLKVFAAQNIETRRKVNDLMRSIVRGVTTWTIVHEYVDGYGGFFIHQLDVNALDTTPLISFYR